MPVPHGTSTSLRALGGPLPVEIVEGAKLDPSLSTLNILLSPVPITGLIQGMQDAYPGLAPGDYWIMGKYLPEEIIRTAFLNTLRETLYGSQDAPW